MLFKFRRHAASDAPRRASPKRQRLPLAGLIGVTLLVASTAQAQINEPIQPLPIQTKLDELIRSIDGAHNALLDLEELDEKDIARIREPYEELARKARAESGFGS